MSGLENGIVLCPADINDIPQILEIVNDIIIHTTTNYLYEPMNLGEMQTWFRDMQKASLPVIVLKQDKKVLAYASYSQFRKKIGYRFCMEHSVYVHKNHQGKGYGKMLMLELIKIARQNKVHTLVAGVDTGNPGSIEFHKKMGFTEVGYMREVGYKFDRWLDLVFLQKTLTK